MRLSLALEKLIEASLRENFRLLPEHIPWLSQAIAKLTPTIWKVQRCRHNLSRRYHSSLLKCALRRLQMHQRTKKCSKKLWRWKQKTENIPKASFFQPILWWTASDFGSLRNKIQNADWMQTKLFIKIIKMSLHGDSFDVYIFITCLSYDWLLFSGVA